MTRRSGLIGAFAVLAFAQTLAYYLYLRDDPGNYNGAGASGDQVAYVDLAQQVLHGTWQGAVHYMPGLPAVIAVSQLAFGDPRLGIAVVQGLIYAALVLYAAHLASRAFGAATGVWAAACVGLNPAIGYYAAQALTEFLTGAVLLLLVGAVYAWSRAPSLLRVLYAGVLIGAAAYLRAEYLALAVLFGALLVWLRGRAVLGQALALVATTALVMVPWVARYAVTTGQPALYNESPFSNLVLMGTWFRVFDEQTFAELQQIETAPGTRDEAIARASTVGPRPDLSQRYMEQARGPYELPLDQTLSLALGNIQLNLRQYVVNHVAEAPILIWAGRTPVRQADASNLPSTVRYLIWGSELALLLLALWQSVQSLQGMRPKTLQRERSAAAPPGADCHKKFGRLRPGPNSGLSAELLDRDTRALGAGFLLIVVFLTLVHVVIAVDERFTTPALPLVGLFAGARLSSIFGRRRVGGDFQGAQPPEPPEEERLGRSAAIARNLERT